MKIILSLLLTTLLLVSPAAADSARYREVMQLTRVHLNDRDYHTAEQMAKIAVSQAKRTFGNESLELHSAQYLMVKVYEAQGETRKAERLKREVTELTGKLFSIRNVDMAMTWEQDSEIPPVQNETNIRIALKDNPDQYMVITGPGLDDYLLTQWNKNITVTFEVAVDRKTDKVRSYRVVKVGKFKPKKIVTRINMISLLQK